MDKTRKVEAYLKGNLSEEERQNFKKQLTVDPELARELKLHQEVDDFFCDNADVLEFRAVLKKVHEQYKREHPEQFGRNPKTTDSQHFANGNDTIRRKRLWLPAAAAVALLAGLGSILFYISQKPDYIQLFEQNYAAYDASFQVRSSVESTSDRTTDAKRRYEKGDYSDAKQIFILQSKIRELSELELLLLGVCEIETGEPEKAIFSFGKIIESANSVYVQDAEWYTALCYLKKNSPDKAVELLRKLSDKSPVYREKAGRLLDDL